MFFVFFFNKMPVSPFEFYWNFLVVLSFFFFFVVHVQRISSRSYQIKHTVVVNVVLMHPRTNTQLQAWSDSPSFILVLPIASLEPEILVEGQSFRVAASCRAVGRPPPRLTWSTDLPGQHQERVKEDGSASSSYSLHPLRSMNGKKLDCMVWHPGLAEPRRIANYLTVHCK